MKTKTLAALSTAVFLSMSVVAHSEECTKDSPFSFQWPNGEMCVPWSLGMLHGGTTNIYNDLKNAGLYLAVPACALFHRPVRLCGWGKAFVALKARYLAQ